MNKLIALLLGSGMAFAALPTVFQTESLQFGKPTAANKRLLFKRNTFVPEIRWNETTGTLQFSNDGSIYTDIAGASVFRNYLDGFQTSSAGTKVLTVGVGAAYDSTNTQFIDFPSAFTKSLAGTWVAGTGNNGLDTGVVAANTTYHAFLIKNPSNGLVDILLSLSSVSPTMPSGYTLKRRIFSAYTDGSSNWITYTQVGDTVYLPAPVILFSTTNAAPITNSTIGLSNVPTGIQIKIMGQAGCGGVTNQATGFCWLASPTQAAPSADTVSYGGNAERSDILFSGGHTGGEASSLYHQNTTYFELWDNVSTQLKLTTAVSSSGNVTVRIRVIGWRDPRGRDGLQ